jgi:hypothetical protein
VCVCMCVCVWGGGVWVCVRVMCACGDVLMAVASSPPPRAAAATGVLPTPEPLAPLDACVRSHTVPMCPAPPCHGVTPGAPQYVHLPVRRKARRIRPPRR